MSVPQKEVVTSPLDRWESNANYWNETIGKDGNIYWSRLQEPTLRKLLASHLESPEKPNRCLELACGNGLCSRWLINHGGDAVQEVLATDGSRQMLENAKERGPYDGRITFQRVDVTDVNELDEMKKQASTTVRKWPFY